MNFEISLTLQEECTAIPGFEVGVSTSTVKQNALMSGRSIQKRIFSSKYCKISRVLLHILHFFFFFFLQWQEELVKIRDTRILLQSRV